MIRKALSEITERDILDLIEAGVVEGTHIEFKRDVPGARDEEKREFLADVSAFANTGGGQLLFGVEEEQGAIVGIPGCSAENPDGLLLRLESLVRDGIEPRLIVAMRLVPVQACEVLVLQVEKSWIGPHRVTFRGHDKFYGRSSAGKYSLDVGQLRAAFLQSHTFAEYVREYRIERAIEIANDRALAPLVKHPKVVLHIVPVGAAGSEERFDVTRFWPYGAEHRPWGETASHVRMTFEGVLFTSLVGSSDGRVGRYAHIARTGTIEAVHARLLGFDSGRIPYIAFEQKLTEYLQHCFGSLDALGVTAPVAVALTLIGVKGLTMDFDLHAFDNLHRIEQDTLMLPASIVESFNLSSRSILKAAFDRVWNACGLPESPSNKQA